MWRALPPHLIFRLPSHCFSPSAMTQRFFLLGYPLGDFSKVMRGAHRRDATPLRVMSVTLGAVQSCPFCTTILTISFTRRSSET